MTAHVDYRLPESTVTIGDPTDPAVWASHAYALPTIAAGVFWWLGELISNAPDHESFVELLNSVPGLEPGTTALMEYVDKRVPVERRRPELSWQHHRAVAGLPPEIADDILDQAAAGNLSVQDVTQAVTEATSQPRGPVSGPLFDLEDLS
ncbi:MAG: hypothetical protein AAF567_24405 [Actinomycetota bacterium]